MARAMTSNMQTALQARVKRPFGLVLFDFDSGALRLWTGVGPLAWDGETWTGSGHLLKLADAGETAETKAVGGQFTLTGVDSAILDLVEGENYQGRTVRLWVGLFDDAGAIIADPVEVKRWLMDVMEDRDDGKTAQVTLSVEDVLAELERSHERRWTDEDQKLDDADDRFFEFVADLQEREIVGNV